MKNFYAIILAFLVIFFACSCDRSNNDSQYNSNEINTGTEEILNENNEKDSSENHPTFSTPVQIVFTSIDDLQDFVVSSNGTSKQYEEYCDQKTIDPLITQKIAKQIALEIKSIDLPMANTEFYEFAATYYADRNEMDVIYRLNGIRYIFVYKYDAVSVKLSESSLIAEDLLLGSHSFDLYQGDECLVGYIEYDDAVLQIIIDCNSIDDVSLHLFDMTSLQ